MPINYSKEQGGWFTQDLNQEEKDSLVNIASQVIVTAMGEQLAHKIMQAAGAQIVLEETPTEEMGNA